MKILSKLASHWICKTVLSIVLFFYIERFCHKQTKGFRLTNILSDLQPRPEWSTPSPDSKLSELFSQTYSFLGAGGQCYSFISEDGTTVLKFFKHHHMRVPSFFKRFPLPASLASRRDRYSAKCEGKLISTFNSCKLAYEEFKEETGLIYVHLNKTDFLKQSVTIRDKLGISYKIDLDQTEFIIQKKAHLVFKDLKRRILHSSLEDSKLMINSILEFIYDRYKKGIKDHDNGLRRNFGLFQDRLIEIDVGSFAKATVPHNSRLLEEELRNKTKRLSHILYKKSPVLFTYYEEKIQTLSKPYESDSL
jgi:hypothetical protein